LNAAWRAALRAASFVLALAFLAAVLYWQRDAWDGIGEAFRRIGIGGLLAITAVHAIPLYLDAIAWRALLEPTDRASHMACTIARWIGESFSSVLPTAQIGGEVARGRALALYGVRYVAAAASVVVDMTVGLVSEMVYVVVGVAIIAMLAVDSDLGPRNGLIAAVVAFGVVIAVMVLAQVSQPFGRLLRRIGDRLGKGVGGRLLGGAAAVETEVVRSYARRSGIVECFVWRLVGWFAGAAEFWLALHLMEVPVDPLQAIALESAVEAARSVAFMIPGGFGVQEAALVALGNAFGLGPDVMLALSFVKRAREYILGGAGILAWTWLERRGRAVKA
jgi:putative membrane protein